jgi:NDP-sugar pyrophosphorylase family protein
VILAGGLGSRLRPFTEAIPKPLLPIGARSLLEIQILRLRSAGFTEVFLATNYKSEYIEHFFGDGSRLGIKVVVSREEKPLGTCGPLALLADRLGERFLVMNGDILTTADFGALMRFASQNGDPLTVVTKEVVFPFEFGNVVVRDDRIVEVHEKPEMRVEILAGIYVLSREILQDIPQDEYFGMDHLIKRLLRDGRPVGRYLLKDYWLDIGRVEDYQKAEDAYREHFEDM